HCSATASSSSNRRAASTSLCPWAASCRASSAPIPLLAPVMTMTLQKLIAVPSLERIVQRRRSSTVRWPPLALAAKLHSRVLQDSCSEGWDLWEVLRDASWSCCVPCFRRRDRKSLPRPARGGQGVLRRGRSG